MKTPQAIPARTLLIGTWPPPVGGVSVHVRRLAERLRAAGCRVDLADDARCSPLLLVSWLKLRLFGYRMTGGRLVHVHSGNWRVRLFAAFFARCFGLRCVITIHSFRALDNPRTTRIAHWTMKLATALVVTNDLIRQRCLDHGAPADKLTVQHAYLDASPADPGKLPEPLIGLKRQHRALIAANAFRLRQHDGQDLYGLDLLIGLMERIHADFPGLGLVFLLPEAGLPEYLDTCRERIRTLGLESCFHIVREALEFTDLLAVSHLMIRPTNTDGDSLSVREALSLGLHVIASDVVTRPEGTTLFGNRDLDDLERVTRDCLARPLPHPRPGQDGLDGLLAVYKQVLHG